MSVRFRRHVPSLLALLLFAAPLAVGQAVPRVVLPGAPGEQSRDIDGAEAARLARPAHTAADVRFMQDMIHHHAQAVEMTALVADRAEAEAVHRLAARIEASQADEIAMMEAWLTARGEEIPEIHPTLPAPHAHHHHHHGHTHEGMPGMLSSEQMARLAAASGPAFDRLFLEYMIFHHEGALTMVEQLFSTEGAGQETTLFQFASHVDSDQRIEIDRMRALLRILPQPEKE